MFDHLFSDRHQINAARPALTNQKAAAAHVYYHHGSFGQRGTKNRSRYQWPRPRGGFICSLLNDRRPFCEEGSWRFVSQDSFTNVCQRVMGGKNLGKEEDQQKCQMTEVVNASGPRVDRRDGEMLQKYEEDRSPLKYVQPWRSRRELHRKFFGSCLYSEPGLSRTERFYQDGFVNREEPHLHLPSFFAPEIAKGQKTKPGA